MESKHSSASRKQNLSLCLDQEFAASFHIFLLFQAILGNSKVFSYIHSRHFIVFHVSYTFFPSRKKPLYLSNHSGLAMEYSTGKYCFELSFHPNSSIVVHCFEVMFISKDNIFHVYAAVQEQSSFLSVELSYIFIFSKCITKDRYLPIFTFHLSIIFCFLRWFWLFLVYCFNPLNLFLRSEVNFVYYSGS